MTEQAPWTPAFPRTVAVDDLAFTRHATERMQQRHISPYDVMLVLLLSEWEFADGGAIRYGFDVPTVSPRHEAIAYHAGIDDVAIVLDRQTCCVITLYRLDDRAGRWWGPRAS